MVHYISKKYEAFLGDINIKLIDLTLQQNQIWKIQRELIHLN